MNNSFALTLSERNLNKLKDVLEETDRTWDFTPLLEMLAPDVIFKSTIPDGTPISGVFQGKEAVKQYFLETLPSVAVFKQQIPVEYISADNRVIMLGDDSFTVHKTGETYRSPYAAVYTFDGELVKDILIIQDLSGIWNAYM